MAKKYQGKSMAKSSRFVAFLKTMDPSDLSHVEERIEFYIQDNKEYCDKGNYQHLCNIFTSMALYDVLIGTGLPTKKAEYIVFETMFAYMRGQKKEVPASCCIWLVLAFNQKDRTCRF